MSLTSPNHGERLHVATDFPLDANHIFPVSGMSQFSVKSFPQWPHVDPGMSQINVTTFLRSRNMDSVQDRSQRNMQTYTLVRQLTLVLDVPAPMREPARCHGLSPRRKSHFPCFRRVPIHCQTISTMASRGSWHVPNQRRDILSLA